MLECADMNEIIAITNQKGGVGKTTTAYNLAAALSRYNRRILLIDMDPQGNCSQALGIDPSICKKTTSELLKGNCDLKHAIRKTSLENVFLIPSNLTLAMVESTLLASQGQASLTLLKTCLEQKEALLYDFIIIDCPPSLGFLSLNALNAAKSIIVPVQCEYFALDALAQLLSSVASVQRSSNPNLSIMGLVMTMFDPRTKLSTEIAQEVRSNFKDRVFTTVIPRNISIPEAIANGLPVNQYKPNSAGSLSYAALAREVLEYAEKNEKN
jgi:chromosome partitioning protein